MSGQIKDIAISDLLFDPENPRLPKSVNGSDLHQVIAYMLSEANIIELMGSIAENGYSPAEPIWVIPSDKQAGKYIIVEGNRRFTAIKLLRHPELATTKKISVAAICKDAKHKPPETVPAVLFAQRSDAERFLGYRHITGVESWDALAKARYLKSISKSTQLSYGELAKSIGSRADYVKLILDSLSVQELIEEHDYFDIPGLNNRTISFGTLYTALNRPSISKFINFDSDSKNALEEIKIDHLRELTSWMFEKNTQHKTRLGESRNLSNLTKVLDSIEALKVFRDGKSLDEAVLLANKPLEIFQESVNSSLSSLQTARNYIHLVDDNAVSSMDTISEIRKLAVLLRDTLRAKQPEQDD